MADISSFKDVPEIFEVSRFFFKSILRMRVEGLIGLS